MKKLTKLITIYASLLLIVICLSVWYNYNTKTENIILKKENKKLKIINKYEKECRDSTIILLSKESAYTITQDRHLNSVLKENSELRKLIRP